MTAHNVFWLDGTPVEQRCASEGVQFAYGLFETMRFDQGLLEQSQEHLNRLNSGLKRLGLNFALSELALNTGFEAAAAAAGMTDGALKVLAMRRGTPATEAAVDVQLYLRANPYQDERDGSLSQPYSLGLSAFSKNSRSVVAGLKWQGYADHIIEKDRASARGFKDVLFLNEKDFVAETAVANIFWIADSKLFTPALDCGILPGIMRQNVLKAAASQGIRVFEGHFGLSALLEAELVFVTNSLMRLKAVNRIEDVLWQLPIENMQALRMYHTLSTAVAP